jgi:hypothetical protein
MLQLAGWNIFVCILAVYSHCLLYFSKFPLVIILVIHEIINNKNNNINRDRNRTNYP